MNFQNYEKNVPRKFTVEFRGDCVHVWSVTSAGEEIFAQLDAKRPKKKEGEVCPEHGCVTANGHFSRF